MIDIEKRRLYLIHYRETHKKEQAERCKKWREVNTQRAKELYKEASRRLRRKVLAAYGGKCTCCGEIRHEFLAMDHIDGNGNLHRSTITTTIFRWLYKNNFPPGFRVHCHNCNQSKGFYGYCPHEKERKS